MDQSRFIAKHVVNLPKSGIRDFFDIVAKMKDAISLGVGEPDFDKGARPSGRFTSRKPGAF